MAGGVLVEQGVIEQDAALRNGAVLGHQRALAQIGRAIVHGDHGLEQLLALLRLDLHGLALFKADGEILDELPLIAQGLAGIDDALGFAPLGRDEAFLGRDVGVEEDALQAGVSAALPLAFGDHTHGQVGAVFGGVVQAADMQAVEISAAVMQVGVVLLPRLHRVVGHTGSEQNGLPQLLHGGAGAHSGEDLLRPGRAGDGGDAPLILVLQLIVVGLHDGIAQLTGLGKLAHVDALQAVGVFGHQVDAAGDHVHIVLQSGFLPLGHLAQRLDGLVAHMELLQRLVVPLHRDLLRLGLIGFLHDHLDEFRLVEIGVNQHLLPLLDIDAAADDQAGIFS